MLVPFRSLTSFLGILMEEERKSNGAISNCTAPRTRSARPQGLVVHTTTHVRLLVTSRTAAVLELAPTIVIRIFFADCDKNLYIFEEDLGPTFRNYRCGSERLGLGKGKAVVVFASRVGMLAK